jgi:spermidine synthase
MLLYEYQRSKSQRALIEVSEVVIQKQTAYQNIAIIKNEFYGSILCIDGGPQSSQYDEYIYHECLVHPAIFSSGIVPNNVFVAGGGEGATTRELLKYNEIKNITMVDIDKELVELCKEHLETMHQGSFSDRRLQLIYDDARKVISESTGFDYIVLDLNAPRKEGPSCRVFRDFPRNKLLIFSSVMLL